ncbi:hypothetical protein EVAR_49195_1 [Eumeta japonica]|uniref:Uncharacterized protein n=1 Tax=Eumeta variegata TaxID=151549 RepID=A0A4C1XPH3_EUMVA|nr:hypothetical protein EVAR_49195_1 [Eumeta japonica]
MNHPPYNTGLACNDYIVYFYLTKISNGIALLSHILITHIDNNDGEGREPPIITGAWTFSGGHLGHLGHLGRPMCSGGRPIAETKLFKDTGHFSYFVLFRNSCERARRPRARPAARISNLNVSAAARARRCPHPSETRAFDFAAICANFTTFVFNRQHKPAVVLETTVAAESEDITQKDERNELLASNPDAAEPTYDNLLAFEELYCIVRHKYEEILSQKNLKI